MEGSVTVGVYGKCGSCRYCEDLGTSSYDGLSTKIRKCTKSGKEYVDKVVSSCNAYEWDGTTPEESGSNKSGGCYVATAVYGAYDCPPVWVLRRYRDYFLAKSRGGRAFIKTYYCISPRLVKRFGNTEWFRRIFKKSLDKKVARLKAKGFEDTPYGDREIK